MRILNGVTVNTPWREPSAHSDGRVTGTKGDEKTVGTHAAVKLYSRSMVSLTSSRVRFLVKYSSMITSLRSSHAFGIVRAQTATPSQREQCTREDMGILCDGYVCESA